MTHRTIIIQNIRECIATWSEVRTTAKKKSLIYIGIYSIYPLPNDFDLFDYSTMANVL